MNKTVNKMHKRKAKKQIKNMIIRSYKPGDEVRLVKFLNLCFGEWGNLKKWHGLYPQYPTFNKDDVFIIEKNGEIIGHESLHFTDLVINGDCELRAVSLSDAAVHPHYRGRGIHNKLMEIMLKTAKLKGAGLVFCWYLRDTGLHVHSKKIGFVEIKQPPAYMKVLRPEKVLRSGLLDFMHKNQKLMNELQDVDHNLCFRFGKSEFSVAELLNKTDARARKSQKKVVIIFDESSVSFLAKFRNMDKRQRLQQLILLVLLRKAKVKFSSFRAFLALARKGVAVIGSI